MSNKLVIELKEQIEREAKDKYPFCWTKNKHGEPIVQRVGQNPHGWSKHQRIINAYKNGAEVYAEKWQEAEQRAATMAEVIEELINIAYPNVPVLKRANQVLADYNTHKQSLTPKTTTDEQANQEES